MSDQFENIVEIFNRKNCKLKTTQEEYKEILKNSKKQNYRLNYIASCGHTHAVFYNVFKSRNTGIVCPECKHKLNSDNKREQFKNKQFSKICYLEQEYSVIKEIQKQLENVFDIKKAFDGCKVDIIYKPKNINENKWIGIQVKTTKSKHLTYGFFLNNKYENCLILLYCCEDKNMWLIPENIIGNQQKISIGMNNSKYNIYKVEKEKIIDRFNELYNLTSKFEFELLNTPENIYQKREQEFRKYREEIIKFIKFDYYEMEGTVYDFKINNLKIQEKVSKMNNNRCIFYLCKNNGLVDGKSNPIQYDFGDNDIYWLNSEDKKYFLVIPEKVLAEKGYIGNINNKTFLKITFKENLHIKIKWLQPYLFNYDTINQESNKIRLLNILNINIVQTQL